MITHNIKQGTEEWHIFRSNHFTASDAPAMMGESPYKTRNELLREKSFGVVAEVDSATRRRFDDGHRFESLARPLAEEIIGAELYPVVGSNGKFAASFDGLTLLEDICFEHKTMNEKIIECKTANELPIHYRIQMEHQLMVSGAWKCLFMATKWNADDQLICPILSLWYESDSDIRQRIVAGWAQFENDLANYTHVETKPVFIGRSPDALPTLRIEVSGAVTASNLSEFKERAIEVFNGIKTELETDEDFSNAEKTTKWCKEVEERLEAAKQHALSQTASIDELFRAVDEIKEEARQKRITLEKLVKQRKESIRCEKIEAARKIFLSHVEALQTEISGIRIDAKHPDFVAAIKGLKTLDSIQNAIDTALANAKIAADAQAKDLREKMAFCREHASGYLALLPDLQQIIVKPMEDFVLTIRNRIEQHKKEEASRIEEERERISQEKVSHQVSCAQHSETTIKIGEINDRLGFNVTADFLLSLGFKPHAEGSAKLYQSKDFRLICQSLINHITVLLNEELS